MRDDLKLYYEAELQFLRQMGQEFADKYPKIASRLVLEPSKCDDPHVERIIEAFAFLAARVHLKIDDEFPEITESLLTILYPHYIRPIPSMSIVEFGLDPEQGKQSTGLKVPRDEMLESRPVGGVPCKFRTCYETTLWPVQVVAAEWTTPDKLNPPIRNNEAAAALRIELRTPPDVPLEKLDLDSLRVYLHGEDVQPHLYELLLNNTLAVIARDPANFRKRPVTLFPDIIQPVGFQPDQGMFPYPRRSFIAYRLLQEYFCFPEKFFFLDFTQLAPVWATGFKDRAELIFLIREFELPERKQLLELGVSAKTFRLGCTPIVNLFPQTSDPILLDQRKYEYHVVPDARRHNATEIFSIEEVVSIDPQSHEVKRFDPFYSYRHASIRDKQQTFWVANRRPSAKKNDDGVEIYLALVDLSMRPMHPDAETLTVRTLCTNRDLPSRLAFGNEQGDFRMEGASAVKRIVTLRKPTGTIRPPVGKGIFWRLISHLSLNYLSLVEEGRDALQEILKLYNFSDSRHSAKQIDGITGVRSHRQFARVISENGISFTRGIHVDLDVDEDQFSGSGVFLFASVLEYFLGLYATLNSFSQLAVRTRQRKEILKEWPPRAGQRILM